MALLSLISPGTIVIPPEKLKQWLCNFFLKGGGGGGGGGGLGGINKVHYGLCENGKY